MPEQTENATSTLKSALALVLSRASDKVPRSPGCAVVFCTDTDDAFSVEGLGPHIKVINTKGQYEGQPAVTVRGPSPVLRAVLDREMDASRGFPSGEIRVRFPLPRQVRWCVRVHPFLHWIGHHTAARM
jgi:hypothetical protein